MSQEQVHSKFKLFVGSHSAETGANELAKQMEEFVVNSKVAAKSIGIEYLEATKQIIMTLGYAENQASIPVKITSVSLGKADIANDIAALEHKMGEVAAQHKNIICHELYVTEEHEFVMVFMCENAA